MKLQIKITKEIYKRAMMCGVRFVEIDKELAAVTDMYDEYNKLLYDKLLIEQRCLPSISTNCAIALAIREIDSKAEVAFDHISWSNGRGKSELSEEVTEMIHRFDKLKHFPEKRLELPEIRFQVDLPDSLVESIGIEEAYDVISKSSTLEFAE